MPERKDDIEKYLNGEQNSADRHRLEKKALSDPFLADALDGGEFLTGREFSQDLNQIRQKITSQKRNFFFWPLRIAAGIVVIISIALITIRLKENETNHQMALHKQAPAIDGTSAMGHQSTEPSKEIPSPSRDQQTSASEKPKRLQNQPIVSEKPPADAEDAEAAEEAIGPTPVQVQQELKPFEAQQKTDNEKDKQTELSDTYESDDKKIAVTPSNDGNATPAATASRSLALRKKSESASGAGIAKEDMQPTMSESNPAVFPVPVGGISQFNKYVQDSLRYPQVARRNNIQGDVIIEFEINANGSYKNFVIDKSLGFGCDEEAIRLIKDGPKWNPVIQDEKVTNNKPRVTIPFRIKNAGN